jgi:hypothetical protein
VLHLASGQPCSVPFARLDYSDFLAKPSPVAQRTATRAH